MGPVRRAHQSNVIAVRVDDDGVARTPERVIRRLRSAIAQGDDVFEDPVYLFGIRVPETHDGSVALALERTPTCVVALGQGVTVECQFKPVRHCHDDVMGSRVRAPDRIVRDLKADRAVEPDRLRHVADNKVQLVQERGTHVFSLRLRRLDVSIPCTAGLIDLSTARWARAIPNEVPWNVFCSELWSKVVYG